MPRGGISYSDREKKFLTENYGTMTSFELADRMPGRSAASLRVQARKMGLTAQPGKNNASVKALARSNRRQKLNEEVGVSATARSVARRAVGTLPVKVDSPLALINFDPMLRRVAREKALGLEPLTLLQFNSGMGVSYD